MDARNCRKCGKIYNYIGSTTPLCPSCMKTFEAKYEEVKQYIYDNPGASITEVSEQMDVTVQQLRQWIREERLSFSDNSIVGIDCERCGKVIKTGRFCPECKNKVVNDLSNSVRKAPVEGNKKDKKDTSARMRYFS